MFAPAERQPLGGSGRAAERLSFSRWERCASRRRRADGEGLIGARDCGILDLPPMVEGTSDGLAGGAGVYPKVPKEYPKNIQSVPFGRSRTVSR